jgi:hypothetical protein
MMNSYGKIGSVLQLGGRLGRYFFGQREAAKNWLKGETWYWVFSDMIVSYGVQETGGEAG